SYRASRRSIPCRPEWAPGTDSTVRPGRRWPGGTVYCRCLSACGSANVPVQPRGGADDRLAGERLRPGLHAGDRRVMERRRLEFAFDLPGEPVPDDIEPAQSRIRGAVNHVAAARALDGLRRRLERVGAELAHAGVQLLVAGAERGHARPAQRMVRVG